MSIRISVDLDDIYDELDSWDKQELLDYLREDGYLTAEPSGINEGVSIVIPEDATPAQVEHLKFCSKLGGLYYRMSNEDMETIYSIIKKY